MMRLTSFVYVTESYLLVARLEAEGIRCVLRNENLVSTQHFLSNALGGIDLMVENSDFQRAAEIMQSLRHAEASREETRGRLPDGFRLVQTFCPECDSSNVCRKGKSFFSFGAKAISAWTVSINGNSSSPQFCSKDPQEEA
jgi:hypothetical protein